MRTFSLTCILIFFSVVCYAQRSSNANLILVINEDLVVGSIANTRIIDGDGREFEVLYYPGTLSFETDDFDRLISQKDDSLTLAFDYYEKINNKQVLCNYELPFHKHWLKQDYLIMKIYNLKKKKYKRMFDPLDSSRNYAFELIYPGGQILRVKSK